MLTSIDLSIFPHSLGFHKTGAFCGSAFLTWSLEQSKPLIVSKYMYNFNLLTDFLENVSLGVHLHVYLKKRK
jgi:hypothetical protein